MILDLQYNLQFLLDKLKKKNISYIIVIREERLWHNVEV